MQDNLIDKIWYQNYLYSMDNLEFYDLLEVSNDTLNSLKEEYKKLLNRTNRTSIIDLERYFGMPIKESSIDGFKLVKKQREDNR
jgi:hypothetical protein